MKQTIYIPILLIIVALYSCNGTRTISGPVTEVKGDTATVNGQRFKTLGKIPKLGDTVTFTETRNRNKVNAKKVQ